MTTALEFLSGSPNPDGLTVDWVTHATPEELERRHDWVQWAFPNDRPSDYIYDAPLVTKEEMKNLTDLQKTNLFSMAGHYLLTLANTTAWRHPGNHNHLRITRVLKCFVMVGWMKEAHYIYEEFSSGNSGANETTLCYWKDALGEEKP